MLTWVCDIEKRLHLFVQEEDIVRRVERVVEKAKGGDGRSETAPQPLSQEVWLLCYQWDICIYPIDDELGNFRATASFVFLWGYKFFFVSAMVLYCSRRRARGQGKGKASIAVKVGRKKTGSFLYMTVQLALRHPRRKERARREWG